MTDEDVNAAKQRLDNDLALLHQNNAIKFGEELFLEFRKRRWFTIEKFGACGTTLFASDFPAYQTTHLAVCSWDVPATEYRVR
jgi:hypothetical protein